ncbi:hypothetical protein R3P38DRAFT_2581312, partial [Favolaschia claudopus]
RMRKAITDLKPKPPTTTDKKTAFWKGYNDLASEYDKEFQQKYGTDLDTSLIFAGLFSAVASAFIIQIQPEFESTPHPLTVIAQSLLYISLGSTLLAALLAVLGKQWLMYYSAAGERGTIETRGLERQRKLDRLKKWKFELIMQAFPLLLQLGLFLFAAALSVYLWRIHHILAGIVLGITAAGTMAYLALLASATFFKDSPFQTPLAPFLRTMISFILATASSILPPYLKAKTKKLSQKCYLQFFAIVDHIKQFYSSVIQQSKELLPRYSLHQTESQSIELESAELDSSLPIPLFERPIPSPGIPAVCWVLETSTDPIQLAEAADISLDLQWPLDMDLPLDVHFIQFLGCFEYQPLGDDWYLLDNLRDGMNHRASQFGQAYMLMQWFQSPQSPNLPQFLADIDLDKMLPELALVLSFICKDKSPRLTNIISQPWFLRAFYFKYADINLRGLRKLVAKLDSSCSLTNASFSEYLFVVYSYLVDGNISSHDVRVTDKSAYQILLYERILKTLPSKIKSQTIDMQLTADILKLTLQLASNCRDHREWNTQWREQQRLTYEFCQALPHTDGWTQVICTPGLLPSGIQRHSAFSVPDAESWIYNALRSIPSPFNEQAWNFSYSSWIYQLMSRTQQLGLLLRENVRDWYTDPELGQKLRDHSMWALFSATILKNVWMFEQYVDLTYLLSVISEWKPELEKRSVVGFTYLELSGATNRVYHSSGFGGFEARFRFGFEQKSQSSHMLSFGSIVSASDGRDTKPHT